MQWTAATVCTFASFTLASFAFSQPPPPVPADLKFEVASIKTSHTNSGISGIRPAGEGLRYEAENCPLKLILQVAYRVKAEQIVGEQAG